jgi:hypothetical protein
MDLDIQSDRRKADRRTDGVTAKILRMVFSIRRDVDEASARDLLSGSGHDAAFIGRVLAIPEERRGRPRRADAAPAAPVEEKDSEVLAEDTIVILGAVDMATLHRLRFESETGMHRLTMADCPGDFTTFGLVRQERDGTPMITVKGRQALRHVACLRALDSVRLGADAIPMSDEVKSWLESNGYLAGKGAGCEVTAHGLSWLALHRPLPGERSPS